MSSCEPLFWCLDGRFTFDKGNARLYIPSPCLAALSASIRGVLARRTAIKVFTDTLRLSLVHQMNPRKWVTGGGQPFSFTAPFKKVIFLEKAKTKKRWHGNKVLIAFNSFIAPQPLESSSLFRSAIFIFRSAQVRKLGNNKTSNRLGNNHRSEA